MLSVLNLGDHMMFPYSRCGLTNVVNNLGTVVSSRQVNVARMRPSILEDFFTAAATCLWNFSSSSMMTPIYFSSEPADMATSYIW